MLLTTTDHDFARLEAKIDKLLNFTRLSIKLETRQMALIDDLNNAEDAINAKLTAITNAQIATKAALDAKDAKLAELATELLAAQQNATGASAAQLQALLDKVNGSLNVADNAAQTEAIFANTPAAPPATPPAPALPVITSLSPANGAVAGGDAVSITGTGFTGATDVSFGGVSGTNLVVNSDTSISVTSPAGTAGDATVVVTTPAGDSAPGVFTYA
jgi:hypothetical protein